MIAKTDDFEPSPSSAVLHRTLYVTPPTVESADGLYLHLSNGQSILDASSGAAVTCLGHNNAKVKAAMIAQLNSVSYCASNMFSSSAVEELCRLLVEGTDHKMSRALIVSSGSEAIESAIKMARQYFVESEGMGTRRTRFIARQQSYHGNTLGALGVGGHMARRKIYEPILAQSGSLVSPCFAYRGLKEGELEEMYVDRLAKELDDEFQRVGPETVCAFVAEPIVGAALGCVPAVPGYFKAVRRICDKYGALLILDEIMCGLGRSGYLHAWQSPTIDVVPDIQTMGKGLGGGYAPVAAMLISPKVEQVIYDGTGAFMNGQTYQCHISACATALAVQKIVRDEDLVSRACNSGILLERLLKERLADEPHVGDIRGMGLFWGIEFVKDKTTKKAFEPELQIAMRVHELGLREPHSISLYPGTGTVDGVRGDHVLIAPPYTCTEEDIRLIVDRTANVISTFFRSLDPRNAARSS